MRPDEMKIRKHRNGGLGVYLYPSVSIKDRTIVVPRVMLNLCLIT
jgi:hypothetical protein